MRYDANENTVQDTGQKLEKNNGTNSPEREEQSIRTKYTKHDEKDYESRENK